MDDSNDVVNSKKTWEEPALVELGDLAELTNYTVSVRV